MEYTGSLILYLGPAISQDDTKKSDTAESMSLAPAFMVGVASGKKVRKGAWRMPWLTEATKDVISCDKLRLGANDP